MKKLLSNKIINHVFAITVSVIASFLMAVGIKVFISPNGFVSVGFQGLGLIIGRVFDKIFHTNLETTITGAVYLLINIPILILAWKKLSRRFTVYTTIDVVVTSVFLAILPNNLNEILHLSVSNGIITFLDAALFVGLLNGIANALCYIFGGSTGGTDVITMYLSVKKQTSLGRLTTLINGSIIIVGLFIDGSDAAIAKTFYTLVYLVLNSIVIDIFYIRNRRAILFITTSKGDEVAKEITTHFIRGVTRLDAKGGYTGEHKDFLYCACSSFEVIDIIKRVKDIDEHAFVSVIEANKVHGNFLNKELR